MANKTPAFNKFNNSKILIPLIFISAVIAATWQFWPLMPQVFFGDDLYTLLSLKDGKCGGIPSQLLITTCQDKFRPVAFGYEFFLLNLFGTDITPYLVVNILLHALSATIVFAIAYRLSKGSLITAFGVALAFAVSRFVVYQVTQMVGGAVEGVALVIFLGVIYSIIRADDEKEDPWRWGCIAILLSFFLIHCHERYIVVFAWLGAAFFYLPNFHSLTKKKIAALVSVCVILPTFNIIYKITVLNAPFMLGTDGAELAFNLKRILVHIKQAAFSIMGFNEGPEYLFGVRVVSLPWYPSWVLASTLALTLITSIFMGVRTAFVNRIQLINTPIWIALRWPILLVALAVMLLVPPISTVRLEMRWLLAPFLLLMLVCAWAVGQQQDKTKFAIWPLVLILSVSSVLIDTVVVKHFNELSFVYSARFAEMVKRDIADKYQGQSLPMNILALPEHCDWTLQYGGFFRIYGGQERRTKCIGLTTPPTDVKQIEEPQVFAETESGQLTDITSEWLSLMKSRKGKVLLDFIKEFDHGNIIGSGEVGTPNKKGVLLLPVLSVYGMTNTITVIPGFSYRFDDILIQPNSMLRFGLGRIFPNKNGVKPTIYITENGTSKPKIFFSKEILARTSKQTLNFMQVSLPLASYKGQRVSIEFSMEFLDEDANGLWLGYSEPQIYVPSEN